MTSGHKLFSSLDALEAAIGELGVAIRLEPEIRKTLTPLRSGRLRMANRFVAQPMEGCDGTVDGRPAELTFRRWGRIAAGGAGMLWGEATAVVAEGRANPRQLLLTRDTSSDLARLIAHARAERRRAWGDEALVVGVQLTHSGRYSYPVSRPAADVDHARVADAYVDAARLAAGAGADFVDVKQCHGYLLSELLSWEEPELAIQICRRIRSEVPELVVASRINVYDGVPFARDPATGRGVATAPADDVHTVAHGRLAVIASLLDAGVELVNVTAGCPYTNPHVGRPADRAPIDGYAAPEPGLVGVARHLGLTETVQRAFPDLPVVGTGYSYLRQFLAMAGEACVRDGRTTLVGVGRGILAYPGFVRDLAETGAMDPRKTCLTVSHCTNLMRSKGGELGQFPAGCVPRDPLYAKVLLEARATWS